MSRPDVWCVQFIARPTEAWDGPPDVLGAFVNCWIAGGDREAAVRLAHDEVRAEGWRVEEMAFVDAVSPQNLSGEAREFFDQAVQDGSCAVFFSWTEEDEEAGARPAPPDVAKSGSG